MTTKKDFEAVARIFSTTKRRMSDDAKANKVVDSTEYIDGMIQDFCSYFKIANGRFNDAKFKNTCESEENNLY